VKRLRAVMAKEFLHILRDPRSLVVVFVLPLLMIVIYGSAISFDVKKIETVVIDDSCSEMSRDLVEAFFHNAVYVPVPLEDGPENGPDALARAEAMLRAGSIKQYLHIPRDFAADLRAGRPGRVGVVIDGSDSNTANIVHQYNERVLLDFLSERRFLEDVLKIDTKMYFNPEVESSAFIVPGLVAVIMIMVSSLLTSLSVARERESGSIALLFISS